MPDYCGVECLQNRWDVPLAKSSYALRIIATLVWIMAVHPFDRAFVPETYARIIAWASN